jgi:hypothetical protein
MWNNAQKRFVTMRKRTGYLSLQRRNAYRQRLVELDKGVRCLIDYVIISRYYKSAGTSLKYYAFIYCKRALKRLKLNKKYCKAQKIVAKRVKRELFMRWETKVNNRCKMARVVDYMVSGYYQRLTYSAFAVWKEDTFVENTIMLYQVLLLTHSLHYSLTHSLLLTHSLTLTHSLLLTLCRIIVIN